MLIDITDFVGTEFKIRATEVDVGLELVRKRKDKTIHVYQCHLFEKLLRRFRLEECKLRFVREDPSSRLSF